MTLVWRPARTPRTVDELTPEDQAQLRVVSKLYYGEVRPMAALLPPVDDADDDGEQLSLLAVAAIEEDGVHAYDEWTYMADSGTHFVAGTDEVVGEIIQDGFQSHRHTEAGARFAAAYLAHKKQR